MVSLWRPRDPPAPAGGGPQARSAGRRARARSWRELPHRQRSVPCPVLQRVAAELVSHYLDLVFWVTSPEVVPPAHPTRSTRSTVIRSISTTYTTLNRPTRKQ